MNPKKTLLLALILLAGAAYAWHYEYRGGQKKEARDAEAKALFSFAPEAVDHIAFETEGQSIALEKSGGEWRITAPFAARADDAVIGELLRAAATVSAEEYLAGSDAEYGLDAPRLRVTFGFGAAREGIAIGGISPTGTLAYAKSTRNGATAAIDEASARLFFKNLFQLREKRLARLDMKAATSLTLAPAGKPPLRLEKEASGRWRITSPEAAPADQYAVDELLTHLSLASAIEFPPEDEQKAAGLQLPRLTITAIIGGAEERLLFGNEAKSRIGLCAMRQGGPLMVIPGVFLREIPSLDDLREKPRQPASGQEIEQVPYN